MAAAQLNNSLYQPLGKGVYLLLLPAILVAVAAFVVPMSTIVVSAFTAGRGSAAHLSISNYVAIVTDGFYWEVLLRTVRVSVLTTLAALALGYPAALFLFFSESRLRQLFLVVAISPLFVSVIVRTYGWIVVLSTNGALNAMLPGSMQVRLLQTESAIIIGLMHIYIPFMLLSLNASLSKIDKRLLSAAASLGASSLRTFWDVILPMSIPGIIAGTTIVFTIAMTAFSTPILLGGSRSKTMPYLIYQQVMLSSDWHMGSALALFLLLTTIVCVFILTRTTGRLLRYGSS
jgi:putative spermidine/putrescine transport system permease protein